MTKLTHSFSALKMFENCPKRYFHQRVEKSVKDEGGEAARYGEEVHKALEERIRDKKPLPAAMRKHEDVCQMLEDIPGAKVFAEQELVLTRDFTPTGWWDEDAWLRSKLDILAIKGRVAVDIDWKTGKRRPDPFQLDLFAMQIFCHYPEVEYVHSTFIWLKDNTSDTFKHKRAELDRLKQNIVYKTKRIEDALENNVWPARPSGLCGYCPCKDFCEFNSRR